jgi:hypothetical protein
MEQTRSSTMHSRRSEKASSDLLTLNKKHNYDVEGSKHGLLDLGIQREVTRKIFHLNRDYST